MNLEDMVVSEISQSEKDKYHMISLIICGIKEKVAHRSREYNHGYQALEGE